MAPGMFLETIRSQGLSHLSYIIGHKGHAAVIDPRRDCHVYVDMVNREEHASNTYLRPTGTKITSSAPGIWHV